MSDKLRVVRDEIERGDEVTVMRHGPVPRLARVDEVLRAAARVTYLDKPGRQELVRFNDLQRCEETPPRRIIRPSSPPPSKTLPAPQQPPVAKPDSIGGMLAEAVISVDLAERSSGEVDAWFEMGKDIAGKLEREIDALLQDEKDLRSDAASLLGCADEMNARAAQLRDRLTLLRQMIT